METCLIVMETMRKRHWYLYSKYLSHNGARHMADPQSTIFIVGNASLLLIASDGRLFVRG